MSSDTNTDTDMRTREDADMDMNHHHDEEGGARGRRASDLPGDDPADLPTRRSRTRRDRPTLFETDAGILVLSDVSSVQCYASPQGSACQVVLRSGVSIHVDMRYSRGLIEAVKAHYADDSTVRSMILDPKARTS